MNGKIDSDGISANALSVELLNPFVHHLELETTYEKIKTAIFTVILLPIRVIIICWLLVTAWLLACIGLYGLTEDDLRLKPITGWRRILKTVTSRVVHTIFITGSFHYVRVKGHVAPSSQARVIVLAPHSSFFDALAVLVVGSPSVVAKAEVSNIPLLGKLINYTQPVYVWRDDPNSRQNTIKEIIDRATSNEDWPQVLIFPEGTCTNRSCLITFKPGAFYPAVPVQPVCIRYPNKLDTVTWTWEGPGALKLLWLTLTQMHSYCEIEFLPVYNPNEAEKKDPKLYARNVRNVMAKALGIPVSDYTYDDCKVITRAKQMNLPHAYGLVEAQKLRHKLGLDSSNTEERILNSTHILCKDCSQLSYPDFANILQIPMSDPALQQLFRLYDKKSTGVIDFREYLFGVLVISKAESNLDMLDIAFKIYDQSGKGQLSKMDFIEALRHTVSMNEEEALNIFNQIARKGKEYVSFDDFYIYAEKKPEFSNLFSLGHEVRRARIIENENHEKIE